MRRQLIASIAVTKDCGKKEDLWQVVQVSWQEVLQGKKLGRN